MLSRDGRGDGPAGDDSADPAAAEPDASISSDHSVPLPWSEARSRLHDVLRQYAGLSSKEHAHAASRRQEQLKEHSHHSPDTINSNGTRLKRLERWLDVWLAHDLDMALALLLSVGFLILSTVTYLHRKRDGKFLEDYSGATSGSFLQPRADASVYKAQLTASVMFVTASIFSMLISRRRRVTSLRDSYVGKRRTVLSFLEVMDNWKEDEEDHLEGGSCEEELPRDRATNDHDDDVQLSGTSLTDIYSVYRLSNVDTECGQWHKIPSLLLVEGDFISLQAGDIAPCKCALLPNSTAGTSVASSEVTEHIAAGERLTIQSLSGGCHGNTGAFSRLPPGRSSLKPENAKELLELCNKTRICVVLETPLVGVLRKGHGELRFFSVIV